MAPLLGGKHNTQRSAYRNTKKSSASTPRQIIDDRFHPWVGASDSQYR